VTSFVGFLGEVLMKQSKKFAQIEMKMIVGRKFDSLPSTAASVFPQPVSVPVAAIPVIHPELRCT
jgi:hypothetical protein